jgi:hypothetical protein
MQDNELVSNRLGGSYPKGWCKSGGVFALSGGFAGFIKPPRQAA